MGRNSAASVEGLPEHSVTEYADSDIRRTGVRGAQGEVGMQARVVTLGEVMIIGAAGTGSEIERRPVRPGAPTIDIIFVERGEFEYLDGPTWRASQGQLMIAPSGLPRRVRFLGEWRFVVVRIPREALLPYLPMLPDEVGVYGDLSLTERAMHGFLAQVVAGEAAAPESEGHTVDRLVLDMAGTLVHNRLGYGVKQGTPRAVLRERAITVIAKRHNDTGLTPAGIATDIGVSLRHLQNVFAEANSSVAAELRRERARVARSLLQDARFDDHSVGEIAAIAGFGSTASMRRALEDLYRFGPRELREGR